MSNSVGCTTGHCFQSAPNAARSQSCCRDAFASSLKTTSSFAEGKLCAISFKVPFEKRTCKNKKSPEMETNTPHCQHLKVMLKEGVSSILVGGRSPDICIDRIVSCSTIKKNLLHNSRSQCFEPFITLLYLRLAKINHMFKGFGVHWALHAFAKMDSGFRSENHLH